MIDAIKTQRNDGKDVDRAIDAFNKVLTGDDPSVIAFFASYIGDHITGVDEIDKVEAVMSMFEKMKPRDYMEKQLIAQMLLVNLFAGQELGRAMKSSDPECRKDATAAATRMLRLYAQQLEALRRYRNVGNQTITVNHNHINATNAIVGNVHQ